jgi:DNA topoisomerase-1
MHAEAIVTTGMAPAEVNRVPEALPGDGAALYALVWKHFIAAHMTPAQERITGARILVGATVGSAYPLELRATAAHLYFDGWRRVLPIPNADNPTLPHLVEGNTPRFVQFAIETVTSEPPHHFTRAGLVGALTEVGLTVDEAVSAVETLIAAEYLSGDDALTHTERGRAASAWLTEIFSDLTSPTYAAELRTEIALIASGEREWLDVLRGFWSQFGEALHPAPAVAQAEPASTTHKPIVLRPVEEG